MERDSLLAHGASFCLNDRLMKCSDYSEGYVCAKCGSILSCYVNKEIRKNSLTLENAGSSLGSGAYQVNEQVYCRVCDGYDCRKIALPYVLRYLTNEMAAMNIRMKFDLDSDCVKEIVTV